MRKVFAIVIGSLLLCSMAGAQQTQTGSISGTVTLEDGSPLPGVTVQATAANLPKGRSDVTNADGLYRFVSIPPGDYKLTFTMPGFATEQRDFPVRLAQNSQINVTLRDATFEGEIIVTSENPTIDTESAELKGSISDDVIDSLPVGQQYRDLVKLIPGVQYTEDGVRGPSAGGSGQDNVYEFDGVGVNLPLFGTLSTEPSSQDIEEMAVVKGGANAVGFNRSGGFLVNTLSKSGTNDFHGLLSYQVQTDSMTGALKTDSESTGDPDKDWAVANIGGPIVKEMLYFFASYYRPTSTLSNRGNVYGPVGEQKSVRDEWFGKLTFTPSQSLLFNASYRDSNTDQSGYGVGQYEAASVSNGYDTTLKIGVLEGSWVITDNSLLSFKYSNFKNTNSGAPDTVFDLPISAGQPLDVDNLDQQGYFDVPSPIDGEDAYNAFIAPLINQYGYSQDNVMNGGGAVGGDNTFDNNDFYSESFQLGYDHFIGKHELHFGYRWENGQEDLARLSNGWGWITVPGGREFTDDGEAIYYQARFWQQSLEENGGAVIEPITSELETQSFEINDIIRLNKWTLNIGLVFSNDKLYGQGLRENSSNVSGYELAPGNKYLMKEVGFDEMISPRLAATWSPNGKDSLFGSYARYYPAATSLPRAASWARNLAREIYAYFDADGNFIEFSPLRASSGKFFQEDITPRNIDEFIVGYSKQFTRQWTGRFHARYRKGQNFWEDTNNAARVNYDPPEGVPQELYIPELDEYRDEVGGSSYVIAELDGAFTKYYELSAEAEWRGSNAYFQGSYVWSHYYGNFDQDNTSGGNDANIFMGSSYIADSNGRQIWQNRYGNLRGDRRHQLKLYGYYQVPWNAVFGAFGIYQSGQPWEVWGRTEWYQGSSLTSRFKEPAGTRTSPSHYQLDLSYTQNFPLGGRYNIQLIGDVFNVFDNQTGYNYEPRETYAGFMEPRSWYDPRRFQLTVAFQF